MKREHTKSNFSLYVAN